MTYSFCIDTVAIFFQIYKILLVRQFSFYAWIHFQITNFKDYSWYESNICVFCFRIRQSYFLKMLGYRSQPYWVKRTKDFII